MKRHGAVVLGAAILITMLAMAGYLGWQLHDAQLARVASFASYYQVLNGYLQSTTSELQDFAETDSDEALAEAVSDMQTVERMAFPLLGLAPKSMSSNWSEFLDHDWNVVTKSLSRLATQNEYFSSSPLPENDRLFLQAALSKFQSLAELMDASAVTEGDAPGVRIRLDQLITMDNLAGELTELANCYVLNGMLPDKLPVPLITWKEAEQKAREELSLGTSEWTLIGEEQSVTELRQGRDYYYLHFEPTSDYQGELKGAVAGIDRQTGRLVRLEWASQPVEEMPLLTADEVKQMALAATEELTGNRLVLETTVQKDVEPSAIVVPVRSGVPILMDSVQLSFDPTTRQLSKWENHSWGSDPGSLRAAMTQAAVRTRLVTQLDLPLSSITDNGLAVIRSPYTDQPTLVYWFTSTTRNERGEQLREQYFVNADNGKLERTGTGW